MSRLPGLTHQIWMEYHYFFQKLQKIKNKKALPCATLGGWGTYYLNFFLSRHKSKPRVNKEFTHWYYKGPLTTIKIIPTMVYHQWRRDFQPRAVSQGSSMWYFPVIRKWTSANLSKIRAENMKLFISYQNVGFISSHLRFCWVSKLGGMTHMDAALLYRLLTLRTE